jgi:5-methylthioadenosine/S-adenosylhomocysteine deaminase
VSDALFRAAAGMARAEQLPIAIHAAESDAEQGLVARADGDFADALRQRGIVVEARGESTIELLDRIGALGARPLLIHCVRVSADDVRRIAGAGCGVAHCPASNAKLGHGVADLGAFLTAGITVGLGSDSVASNNRMDILDEARLALLFARARHQDWHGFPASRGVELSTLGGARALGLEQEIGSLDVGKSADLAAFPLDRLEHLPVQEPETALVFAGSGRGARLVTVAGAELVKDGRLVAAVSDDLVMIDETARTLRQFAENGAPVAGPPRVG